MEWNHPYDYPNFSHTLVEDPEEITQENFYNRLIDQPLIAFDFETTGLHYKRDKPVGLSLAVADHVWYLYESAMLSIIPWLKDAMQSDKTLWLAHNIKFDMHFTNQFGFTPNRIFDTQLAQWSVNENESSALKHVSKIRFDVPDNLPEFDDLLTYARKLTKKKKDKVTVYDIPQDLFGVYGAYDSRLVYDLYPLLVQELKEEDVYEIFLKDTMPFTKTLMRMESNGIRVDIEKSIEAREKLEPRRDTLLEELENKTKDILGYAVNFNSHQQLRELLFKGLKLRSNRKTKGGELSTDRITLLTVRPQDKTGTVDLLLEYRQINKVLTTYINAFISNNLDGRMYANFNQTGTVTGRLSSKGDTNLQNQPSRGEFAEVVRSLYIADDGCELLCSDYSQMELRLLAHKSRDITLIKSYLWGRDIHQLTADKLGVPRYIGKTLNFGINYGAFPGTICNTLVRDGYPKPKYSEAKRWLKDHKEAYPGIYKWKDRVCIFGRKHGYVFTIAGRKRHVAGLNHWDEYTRGRAERQAINSIIQGSAGDAINRAMLDIDDLLEGYGASMNIQVHDELLFNVPKEVGEEFLPVVKSTMEAVEKTYNISVPIVAEPSLGNSWWEAK
jgi:DNA polymerase-1